MDSHSRRRSRPVAPGLKSGSSSGSSSGGTCSVGDKGDAVKKVQKRLIALGYLSDGGADGSYGNQT
ncbi:MAG: peptidoglycan-binding protein, partial [Oscillospiraceae bacterium]|nr:peptidoglycan-binding protein [Oscillospiraceae bacterium]